MPFCHTHFGVTLVSKQQIVASAVNTANAPYPTIAKVQKRGLGEKAEPTTVFYADYQLAYRCRHRGKEWQETSQKEFVGEH